MGVGIKEIEAEYEDLQELRSELESFEESGETDCRVIEVLEDRGREVSQEVLEDEISGGSQQIRESMERLEENHFIYSRNCLGLEDYSSGTRVYGLRTGEALEGWYSNVNPC